MSTLAAKAAQAAEDRRPDSERIEAALGSRLLTLARDAILARLGRSAASAAEPVSQPMERPVDGAPEVATAVEAMLQAPGASFVTLTADGDLRGCIGTLEAWRALAEDVAANAQSAAFSDYRFPPLTARELPSLRVEVSVLGPARPLAAASEDEAIASLVPGRDGVILAIDGRRATYLPQVWDSLPDPQDFLSQLKRKAGLPTDFWSPSIALWRYEVRKWREPQ